MNRQTTITKKEKVKKVHIDPRLKLCIYSLFENESQVIIKCSYKATNEGESIRISKSTFLVPHGYNLYTSRLIFAHNISMYPEWTLLKAGVNFHFTLVFSCLPKDCKSFDMIENIATPGAIIIRDIQRNDTDIYNLNVTIGDE